jgi:LEA14-like dessication related protein
MKVDSVNLTGAEILVTFNVENPNVFSLPPVKIDYEYLINRSSFLKSSMQTAGPIAASSVTPVNIRFPVNYADVLRTFQTLFSSSEVSTLFYLAADFGVPAFSDGEAFRHEIPGTLPLL